MLNIKEKRISHVYAMMTCACTMQSTKTKRKRIIVTMDRSYLDPQNESHNITVKSPRPSLKK